MSTNANQTSNEIWKPVLNYEGLYEVSNLFRVKSLPKEVIRGPNNAVNHIPEKILKPTNEQVSLVKDKKKKTLQISFLYKQAFENYVSDGKRKKVLVKADSEILIVSKRIHCAKTKLFIKGRKRKYTGVSKSGSYFRADIHIQKKEMYLGTFETEKDAHKFYLFAAKNEHLYNGNAKDFRIRLNSILNTLRRSTSNGSQMR